MQRAQRGFSIIELLLAGVVIAALLTSVVKFLGVAAGQRRGAERRQVALVEASNVMQRITARPWAEVTEASLAEISLSAEAARFLPEGSLAAKLSESPDEPAAKRVALEVRWPGPPGAPPHTLRLMSWMYRRQGADNQ
jgi:type II secretory pathway pseudopilin PulG